jgi:hypothetical protein
MPGALHFLGTAGVITASLSYARLPQSQQENEDAEGAPPFLPFDF